MLRSPDSKDTPFPEVLSRYTRLDPGWVELRPEMELRIENAYYRPGTTQRIFANFLGTGIARYRVRSNGSLRLISVAFGVAQRPSDQPPLTHRFRGQRQVGGHLGQALSLVQLPKGQAAENNPHRLDSATQQTARLVSVPFGQANMQSTISSQDSA